MEYARYSEKRGGAPTLVPVKTDGALTSAELLILNGAVSLSRAREMLWRRETRREDPKARYVRPAKPGAKHVLVEILRDFEGLTAVVYTDFAHDGKVPDAIPGELARRAVASVSKAEKDHDGITYLINASL